MAIAFDATAHGVANPGSSLTYAHTCTGSNLLLFVGIEGDSTNDIITGVTYNSVAMTRVDALPATTSGNRWFYLYYLVGPATGANNVVVSASSSIFISAVSASYTGAQQSGVPDSSNKGGATTGTSLSISTTTVADNCWVVGYMNGAAAASASGGTTIRGTETTGQGNICDKNGVVTPAGSASLGITWTGSNGNGGIVASFAPVVAGAPAGNNMFQGANF